MISETLDTVSLWRFTKHSDILNALKSPTERDLNQASFPKNPFLMLFLSQGTS